MTIDYGSKIVRLFEQLVEEYFSVTLRSLTEHREHVFWALGLDSKRRSYRDLIGNVDESSWSVITKDYFDTDAGMQASAQERVALGDVKADIFLINVDHLKKGDAILSPLIVHEICHYIEQIGISESYELTNADKANAVVVMSGLDAKVRSLHTLSWARLLCRCARLAVSNGKYESVRHFLEIAIPSYDRPHWKPAKIIEK